MFNLRVLYARIVLWFIRPALELHLKKMTPQREEEIERVTFNKLLSSSSAISTAVESVYGLTREGK